jgi:hypothetical protein
MTISFNEKRGNEMTMAINFRENPRPLTRTKTKNRERTKSTATKKLEKMTNMALTKKLMGKNTGAHEG